MRRFFLAAWEANPPLYDEIPALFSAAEQMAGDPKSVLAKRVRFFKLGWELYYSSLELDEALKAGDIPAAHRIVKAGIRAAEATKTVALREELNGYHRTRPQDGRDQDVRHRLS